jgi:PadR family transcriptional regulator, regulatory protein PadR
MAGMVAARQQIRAVRHTVIIRILISFFALRCGKPDYFDRGCEGNIDKTALVSLSSPKSIMERTSDTGQLIQGTLEMLILKALALGPLHGYGVAEWIHQTSQQMLKVEEGALYPALHRMELRGMLKARWGASDNNWRAKFYELTAEGQKRLHAEAQRWARLSSAVAFVMQAS